MKRDKVLRKSRRIFSLLAAALIVALVAGTALLFSACQEEKFDAFIEAGNVQRVSYDGTVHYPAARLNHEETQLVFEGGDAGDGGCKEPGSYDITVYAAETENYKAQTAKIVMVVEERSALNDDVFAQMVRRMQASGDFDLNESIAIDLSLGVQFSHQSLSQRDKDWEYTFSVRGNLNFLSPADTLLQIGLFNERTGEDVIKAVYDGADSVIWLTAAGERYKIENARLIEALLKASGAGKTVSGGTVVGIDTQKLGQHLYNAAATVLSSGQVSADGDVFTFDFHMDNLLTSTVGAMAEAFMPGVGQQLGRLLYATVKEDVWSGLQAADLPALRGTLEIRFDGDKFAGMDIYDIDYADQQEKGVFLSEVSPVTLGNGRIDTKDMLPSGEAWTPTKMLNLEAGGTLQVVQDGAAAGTLGWSARINMDLAEFIVSGGDFSAQAMSDNMFHISLWFDPATSSSSAWADSGDRAQALSEAKNIIDIIYDPRHTGTSMVYVSFAPLTLMNNEMIGLIDEITDGMTILGQTGYERISEALEGYSMIQLDINAVVRSMAFRAGESSEAFDALGGAVGFLSRIMSAVSVDGGVGAARIEDIAEVVDKDFGEDPMLLGVSLGEVIQAVFSANGKNSDALRLTVENFEMFSSAISDHNAVQSGLINNFDGKAKTYHDHFKDSINDTPVMTPHIQGYTSGNQFFIKLFNQSLPNGVEGEVYTSSADPFSAEEAAMIDKFAIGYTYTDIYGNSNDNIYTARIIRMEGYDPQKTGPQYVTIYTEPIEGYNILTNFDNMLRVFSDNKISFEGYCVKGWINVNAELVSARARSDASSSNAAVSNYSGGEVKEFAVGDELLSSLSFFSGKQYKVELTYEGGATKIIYIDAEADEFTFSDPSVVSYSEQKGMGQGTRKTWRAGAPGETDMILKTALGEFVWKIKIV